MGYGTAQGVEPPRNRHRWVAIDNTGRPAWQVERGSYCEHCGITRTAHGWSFRGDRHDGPIPRCGEAR